MNKRFSLIRDAANELCRRRTLPVLVLTVLTASVMRPAQGEASGENQAETAARQTAPPVSPNRALPRVQPPKMALEFSASPTTQELFRARVFEEPLVPIGGEPSAEENAALGAALLGYTKRSGPDDFASLTAFLERHPKSPWRAALHTDLGLEYYNTAHYSLALEAWEKAWPLAKEATDAKGRAIADRAAGELASMYARLGRMAELETLLRSIEGRELLGPATEKISCARAGLSEMKDRPEISFRCGPLALHRILLSLDPKSAGTAIIFDAASTTNGFSLPQVAAFSQKVGLKYQMALRDKGAAFMVPSVVHWRVGHYAALLRQEGDRFLLQDPTFRNDTWVTSAALEEECSGYFLVPSGALPTGWRAVKANEGDTVWGKGNVGGPGPGGGGGPPGPGPPPPCKGMAVSSVDLLFVSLTLTDEPVSYSPPVGPPVRFMVTYNQRDAFQPANFSYSNFGPKWTFDWVTYIKDDPTNPLADVEYYRAGGFARFFTGFSSLSQSYALQQLDLTKLTRTSPTSYEMVSSDGSKKIFSRPDGSVGTTRKLFLTQMIDPFGNIVSLTYDANLRIVAVTDAIGQVTTLTYGNTNDIYKITRVTDPFGRFATFDYDSTNRLVKITDVIGLTSQFIYEGTGDFISSLVTPYGTNTFIRGESGTTRFLETLYPDGSRDRVEFNQSTNLIAMSDSPASVPKGMSALNDYLAYRNTFYWSRTACATGYGDYSKAKIYHWLHTADINSAARILESTKEPLEGRAWRDYSGQASPVLAGSIDRPTHVGRVLDDGSTQLYTYAYDGFGHVTNSIDPVGRTFSYLYAGNGIDLLEVRQTRAGNNELLFRATYNAQHLPLTKTDAAGQTNTFTYNARGQLLTETNPKGETTAFTYDTNGYLIAVDGPLPGTNDVVRMTYDAAGRTLTKADVSGYTVTFEHDNLDRLTKITHPDATFSRFTYDRLDMVTSRDRAGRQTLFEYDNVQQMKKKTDSLGRETLFDWCRCGDLRSLTDAMGRTTSWHTDVQGRVIGKQYGDGSLVRYVYENTSSRLLQKIDEKQQISHFTYNLDNTIKSVAYANAAVPTPGVNYTYDPNYKRTLSMTDGSGTTLYSYHPVTTTPTLGANQLATVDGPLPNDTITYGYDELGRRFSTAINGIASMMVYDASGRIVSETNALGIFTHTYDGASSRVLTNVFPNGLIMERAYGGDLEDHELQRITHKAGATAISEFLYGHDHLAHRITTWSQRAGTQTPDLHTFGYDAADQLLSATITNSGNLINTFAYAYDPAANRLIEQVGLSNFTATHNALNQISTTTAPSASRTNEWDAKDRLVAVNIGNQRTEFAYDGLSQMVSIRQLTNGSEVSLRRFVWCDNQLCEERDAAGVVTKRYFPQGMKLEIGPNAGRYYYTRDHLGSIRELTDASGNMRARYAYDPFGRRTQLTGDLQADFGFTGLFFAAEAGLSAARFRIYDAEAGRWLSRDPLRKAELREGPNLYAYVANSPINAVDPLGLMMGIACCEDERKNLERWRNVCQDTWKIVIEQCELAKEETPEIAPVICLQGTFDAIKVCNDAEPEIKKAAHEYFECMVKRGCRPPKKPCPKKFPFPNDDEDFMKELLNSIGQ